MTIGDIFRAVTNDPTIAPTIVLVLAFVAAGCMESRRVWVSQAAHEGRWIVNLGLAVVNYGIIGGAAQVLLTSCLDAWFVPASTFWPNGLFGGVCAFLILDLLRYWLHRLFHAAPILWQLHAFHHSDRDVDVTTTFRHNPVEFALLSAIIVTGQAVLGISAADSVGYVVAANTLSVIGHANLQLPRSLESAVSFIVLTPHFHAVHHSVDPAQHHKNFGSVLTIWDQMFGTFSSLQSVRTNRIIFGLARSVSFASKGQT